MGVTKWLAPRRWSVVRSDVLTTPINPKTGFVASSFSHLWRRVRLGCQTHWEGDMDSTTLIIIILLVLLLGGGGYYGRGRWW